MFHPTHGDSLDVTLYYNFAHSELHCRQNKNSYQDGDSPTIVDQSLVLGWAYYKYMTSRFMGGCSSQPFMG